LASFLEDRTQSIDRVDLQTITRLFEKQVEKTPAKIAAVYQDGSLTFQELNEQADKLANLIRRLNK
jgi:surfactin family lipopeptide synthetase C